MSPAKMFAYMKKREGRRGRQDVHRVCNSMRDLFNRSQCYCLEPFGFYSHVNIILLSMTYAVI